MNLSTDAQNRRFNWLKPIVHLYSILWAAALTVLLMARSEASAALPFVLSGLPVFAVLLFLNRPRVRSAFQKPAHLTFKIILNIFYILIPAAFLLNWMVPSDRLPATGSISHLPLVGLY
ncbi:MAG: hypothetical protein KDK27_14935, partial [Leptospiraceae bacterium]|nr:hypothetical protein [Leptospiraceae bacterium]